jgi:hypothetical protein
MPNAMIQPMASVVAEASWAFDEMVQARMKNQLNSFTNMQSETQSRTMAYQAQRDAATQNGEAQRNGLLSQAYGSFGEAGTNIGGLGIEFGHDMYKNVKVIGPAQAKVDNCAAAAAVVQRAGGDVFVQADGAEVAVDRDGNGHGPQWNAGLADELNGLDYGEVNLDAAPVGGGLTVREKINQLNVEEKNDLLKEVRRQKKDYQTKVTSANSDKDSWNQRIRTLTNSGAKFFEAGFRMQQAAYAADQARWQGDQALWQADTSLWDSAFKGMDTMQDSSTQSINAIYRMRAEIAAANHA